MTRTDIINIIINKIGAKKYLEIGVAGRLNYKFINCEYKLGVDPFVFNQSDIITSTSDSFFLSNTQKFDVIFIDGEHHAEQVYRDINNSLSFLESDGYIICHDMKPDTEKMQLIPNPFIEVPPKPGESGNWMGDCWKAWIKIRSERDDLEMFVVDTDAGCGVIRVGKQEKLVYKGELTWNNFDENKEQWLNLISVDEFKNNIKI